MSKYKNKYLKYKNKYLYLKKLIGGKIININDMDKQYNYSFESNPSILDIKNKISDEIKIPIENIELKNLSGQVMNNQESINTDITLEMKKLIIHSDISNPSKTKIALYIGVFSDGAGDFSFANKLIKLLLSMGISEENIFLNILNFSGNDIGFRFFSDDIIKCYNNNNKITELKSNEIPLTNDMLEEIIKIITPISQKYKNFFNLKGYDNIKQYHQTIFDINKSTQQNIDLENIRNRLYEIYNMSIKLTIDNNNIKCKIYKKTFKEFIDIALSDNFWNTFINYCETYLIKPFPKISINFIKKELPIYPLYNIINNIKQDENLIILTFLHNKFNDIGKFEQYIKNKPFNKYRLIAMNEGGFCSQDIFSTGFNLDSKCIGINITPIDKFKNTTSPYTEEKYHVCYFGNLSEFIEPYTILMGYKMKFFINIVTVPIIFVNEICYNLLLKYNDIYKFIFGCNINNKDKEILIEYKDKNIHIRSFPRYEHDTFLSFLYHSEKLCIMSGDQSYYEGISMGKIVLYDFLAHKMGLMRQIYSLYCEFIKEYSLIRCNIPKPIPSIDKFTDISKKIKRKNFFINNKDDENEYEPIIPLSINDNEKVKDTQRLIYKNKTQRLILKSNEFSFILSEVNKIEETKGKEYIIDGFPYKYIDTTYNEMLKLSKEIFPHNTEKFIKWLNEKHNFEKKFRKNY
jgi:hypothetical protein